jgi:hypothetical protein
MFRALALVAATALMAGCAAQSGIKPLALDDPANPQAPEAPVASIAPPLTLDPLPAPASDTRSPPPAAGGSMQHTDMKGMDMKGMDMPDMPGMRHGQKPAATQPPPDMEEGMHHSPSGPATQPATTQALYTCNMHPQIVSNQPGKCPICGMTLVAKEGVK